MALMVHRVQGYFPRKSKTKNHLVKNTVNVKKSRTLFSYERIKLKITQSKIPLIMQRVECYFLTKE